MVPEGWVFTLSGLSGSGEYDVVSQFFGIALRVSWDLGPMNGTYTITADEFNSVGDPWGCGFFGNDDDCRAVPETGPVVVQHHSLITGELLSEFRSCAGISYAFDDPRILGNDPPGTPERCHLLIDVGRSPVNFHPIQWAQGLFWLDPNDVEAFIFLPVPIDDDCCAIDETISVIGYHRLAAGLFPPGILPPGFNEDGYFYSDGTLRVQATGCRSAA